MLEHLVELGDELRARRLRLRRGLGVVDVGGHELRGERRFAAAAVACRCVVERRRARRQACEQQRAAGGREADRARLLRDLLADQPAQLALLARAADPLLDLEPQRLELDLLPRGVALERLTHAFELGRQLLGRGRAQRFRVQPRLE
jgi:hypothetical protein